MNKDQLEQKVLQIPKIKTESETQTSGQLILKLQDQDEDSDEMEAKQPQQTQSIRKRRNLSKNRPQTARQREKTPEPGRTTVHEDTPTSEDEEPHNPRSSREIEADTTYEEMKRLVQEQSNTKDPVYDMDVDEIREARYAVENERRRRSISPFAVPEKLEDHLCTLQRKGSFMDPTNKLLSATYTLTPKDDEPGRRGSLTIDTVELQRKNSMTPPTPTSSSPKDNAMFGYPTPAKKLEPIIYPDEPKPEPIAPTRENKTPKRDLKTPTKKEGNEFTFEEVKETPKARTPAATKQSESAPGELVTKVIKVERTPSKTLAPDQKPVVEIRQRVVRTPSRKTAQENRPAVLVPRQPREEQQVKPASTNPPVKPARSKSASRFGGKTSESEMSEDQGRVQSQEPRAPRRKVVPTPRRFVKNKSPRAKRSQSAARIENVVVDKAGTGMSQTSKEIIELMQQARARSLSIPKDDINIPKEYRERQGFVTPKKIETPASRRTRGISCPKTIQIISDKEILAGLTTTQRLDLEFEKRRNRGYIDASQSEYTSSCYSSSPSENEHDFDLSVNQEELNRKLSLLSDDIVFKEETKVINGNIKTEIKEDAKVDNVAPAKSNIRKRSTSENKKEKAKLKEESKPPPEVKPKKITKFSKWLEEWRNFKTEQRACFSNIRSLRNRCISDTVLLIILCGLGGLLFKNLEGSFENAYKCGSRSVKRDFIESLWKGSHYLREEDWKSLARTKLFEFENQLYTAHEAGVKSYSGQRSWNFMNSFVYCLTIVTTIGYGHIAPTTTNGRIATIVYAIIGIPLFLIVLADFGKLFTRILKLLWAFIRRVHYTGSCKKVRRTVHVEDVMKGLNVMYGVVRRPSQMFEEQDINGDVQPSGAPALPPKPDESGPPPLPPKPGTMGDVEAGTEPETPAPSVFEIDDEFNLPISVAIVILVIYILAGALVYSCLEKEWSFFESFYFVFISMTTIGLGDLVPNHPMFMMASILYLVFGLALTSMCINVVQVKLSDTFKQASAKLGATIGLKVAEEDGGLIPITPQATEIAPVHRPTKADETGDKSKEKDN